MSRMAALVVLLLVPYCGQAVAAPSQLYGKSVVISYTGTINARPVGSSEPYKPRTFQKQISVYISSTGRPFMRNSSSAGRAGSASLDQVGASGANQSGGASNVQFQGRSLVVVFVYEGGAAHIQADFDASFSSCTADVIRAKSAGNNTRIAKGMVTGTRYEVESSTTSGVSCSIKDGNVFAQ
jgi:hypothetical protein